MNKVDSRLRSAQFIGGAEMSALEQSPVQLFGSAHAIGCASGTDALQLALRALRVAPGDWVLVSNAGFRETFEAVVNAGASPATVQVSPRDGAMDIGFGNIYPGAMSAQPGAKSHLGGRFGGTQSEQLCQSVLNLPLFAYVTQDELGHVVSAVSTWSH